MNKTFNINLGGYPFAIDDDAYTYIHNYLSSIRSHFSTSEGCDEILYDIEVRMAELFQDSLRGRSIIGMKEVDEVIAIMGKPEDFGADPIQDPDAYYSSHQSKAHEGIGVGKRLFRDPDDKKIAGVCSGISNYFGIEDPIWIRLAFVVLVIVGGVGIIPYILLWILVPLATTAGDKLAMKGEPTTIQNIANLVEREISDLGDQINKWSHDIGSKKKSSIASETSTIPSFLYSIINAITKVLNVVIKVFFKSFKALFIAIAIILVTSLAIAWAASVGGTMISYPVWMSLGPKASWISFLGMIAAIIIITVPILWIIFFISRLAFRYRPNRNFSIGMMLAWIGAIVVASFVAMKTVTEYSSMTVDESSMTFPTQNKTLIIKGIGQTFENNIINLGPIKFLSSDGINATEWMVPITQVIVHKRDNVGNIQITKSIYSKGASTKEAKENMSKINSDIYLSNETLFVPQGMIIGRNDRFRDQKIIINIDVPKDMEVKLDPSLHLKEFYQDETL